MSKDIEWLIEEVLNLYPSYSEMYKHPDYPSGEKIDLINSFIELIDELDEPEKIIIPQFVADHIEKHKGEELNLISRLDFVSEEEFEKKTKEWLYSGSYEEKLKRQHLLIDAIRYGYEVEKEPQWVVKDDTGYLSYLQFSIPNIYERETSLDKNDAYKFNSKSKAGLIADLVNGVVEEVTE